MIKTPKFWLRKNLTSYLLLPLSCLYFVVFYLIKYSSKRKKINKRVICVGNLIAGGSGKTPSAILLGEILHDLNISFCYLSRGYKGSDKNNLLKVDSSQDAKISGDEPLLLSEVADTYVSNSKINALREIDKISDYKAVVLDDGIQNNLIFCDIRIIVVDAKIGFGNGFLLPAGPLREDLTRGLKKADIVIVIGKADNNLLKKLENNRVVEANIVAQNSEEFKNKSLIAFCGIAYPDKFFSYLKEQGLNLLETFDYKDHHFYTNSELEFLLREAKAKNASLITTKKDWVKFPKNYQEQIPYLDIKLELQDESIIIEEINKKL